MFLSTQCLRPVNYYSMNVCAVVTSLDVFGSW
jgi:hypothetical protein